MNSKKIQKIVNDNRFKIVIFVFVLSSIFKLILQGFGYTGWYCKIGDKQFTEIQTTLIYYGLLLFFLTLYLVFVWDRKKWSHVIMLSLTPLSIMFCLTSNYLQWILFSAFVIFGSLIALDVFLLTDYLGYENISDKLIRRVVFCRKFLSDVVINLERSIIYAGLILVFWVVVWNVTVKEAASEPVEAIAYATNVRDLKSTTPTNLWEPNKDKLRLLSMEVYQTLELQERVNALQELLNIECEYLGIEPCQLLAEDIEQESQAGYYSGHRGFISVDIDRVEADSAAGAIYTVLHEVYHYYQAECMKNYELIKESGINEELLFYRDCRSWAEDLANYYACENPGDYEDYYRYASQSLETSANDYADEWINAYWSFINGIDVNDAVGSDTETVVSEGE